MDHDVVIDILGKMVEILRDEGVECDSPYDFTNFIDEHAGHDNLFETEKFEVEDD